VIGFGSECLGTADAMWASGSDGTLWRIGALSASTPVRFEALTHAAATRDAIAVVDAEQLWINRSAAPGEPLGREEAWSRWQFDTGSPTDLSASGGAFWMLVAGETVVYRDGGFSRVDLGMKSGTPTRITAHDTGAWVVSNEALCHVSTGPMVRVQGAHPFSRSRLTDLPITIELPEQATEFDATLNGEPLTLSEDPEAKGRWSTTLNLTPRSWNDLRLRTDSTERQIPLRHEQLDWARHIQPIQQAFCSGCHGADSSAALDTEDAWVSAKEAICNQVVLNDQMPKDPTAAWTENRPAYKATIHQWLKGQNAACEIQP
jgi:hypothetical protein